MVKDLIKHPKWASVYFEEQVQILCHYEMKAELEAYIRDHPRVLDLIDVELMKRIIKVLSGAKKGRRKNGFKEIDRLICSDACLIKAKQKNISFSEAASLIYDSKIHTSKDLTIPEDCKGVEGNKVAISTKLLESFYGLEHGFEEVYELADQEGCVYFHRRYDLCCDFSVFSDEELGGFFSEKAFYMQDAKSIQNRLRFKLELPSVDEVRNNIDYWTSPLK